MKVDQVLPCVSQGKFYLALLVAPGRLVCLLEAQRMAVDMLTSAMPCRHSHIPRAHGSAHRAAAAFLGLPQHRPAVDSATVEMQSEHKGSGSLRVLEKNFFILEMKNNVSSVSLLCVLGNGFQPYAN